MIGRIEGLLMRLVAAFVGVRVTSWIRTTAENQAVGGVVDSKHLTGEAMDVGIEAETWQRRVLRLVAREVVEGAGAAHSTGPHLHYEVDGRGWKLALGAFGAVCLGVMAHSEHKA